MLEHGLLRAISRGCLEMVKVLTNKQLTSLDRTKHKETLCTRRAPRILFLTLARERSPLRILRLGFLLARLGHRSGTSSVDHIKLREINTSANVYPCVLRSNIYSVNVRSRHQVWILGSSGHSLIALGPLVLPIHSFIQWTFKEQWLCQGQYLANTPHFRRQQPHFLKLTDNPIPRENPLAVVFRCVILPNRPQMTGQVRIPDSSWTNQILLRNVIKMVVGAQLCKQKNFPLFMRPSSLLKMSCSFPHHIFYSPPAHRWVDLSSYFKFLLNQHLPHPAYQTMRPN